MFRCSHFVIAMALIALLALSACGQGKATEQAAQALPAATSRAAPVKAVQDVTPPPVASTAPSAPEPTYTAAPAPTEVAEPSPTEQPIAPPVATPPTPVSTPTAFAGLNGRTPDVDQVSLTPAGEELATVEAVKILTPSVVQIVVTQTLATGGFFNQPVPNKGVGTGVILDQQGNILTNNHVVDGAEEIIVTLSNGDSFPAEMVGGDLSTDLAIIRIEADGLTPAKLGASSELQVGQEVIAIGHALGLPGGPTVSKGVVSALGRSIDSDARTTIIDLIQTDAAINPGNSGGALVNTSAEVIGINTAIIRGTQGIGFAINIDDAKIVAAQLMERGYVQRGFLGITPVNLNPGLAHRFDLPVTEGILIARLIPGNPAEKAGLRPEDVIVQLGDQTIANNGELSKFLIAHLPGETVKVVYYRGKTEVTTKITLGERPK